MDSQAKHDLIDNDEEFDRYNSIPAIRNMPRTRLHRPVKKAKSRDLQSEQQSIEAIASQSDTVERFDFTYQASRHEREWLIGSLGNFYDGRWIDDILHIVKGGKEASVYLCTALPTSAAPQRYIAAKVYRPRKLRNLRNDHLYREGRSNLDIEGREIRNEGMQHAMRKRTEYGLELLHTSWIGHEFKTMQLLYGAGVDLPQPLASDNNAILMSYIGAPGMPAPTLNTVELDKGEAALLFKRILENLDRMLAQGRVHGDLSAYNVLYWEGQITLIDFPQAINPAENRSAYRIFERDVARICEYFSRQGVPSSPALLARELWTAHGYHLQPEVHPRLLDEQDEHDRQYWQGLQNS